MSQPKWYNHKKWEVGERVSKRTWRMIDLGGGRAQSEAKAVRVQGTLVDFSSSRPLKALVEWDEQPAEFQPMGKTLEEFHRLEKEPSTTQQTIRTGK